MINLEKHYKLIMIVGTVILWALFLRACTPQDITWKEEVQLNDGKVIVVERETIREAGGDEWASNRSGSKPKTYCITFEYPIASGQKVRWCSAKVEQGGWPEVPLVMDIESSTPIIFTALSTSSTCNVYSKYVYRNAKWTEEKLPEQFSQHATNLLFGSKKGISSLVGLQDRQVRNDEPGYARAYKQVGPSRKVCGE